MKKFGLKPKVALYCILFTTLLTLAIVFGSYGQFRSTIMEKYHDYAKTVLDLAESYCTRNDLAGSIAAGEMKEGYQETRRELNTLKEDSTVAYIYAVYFKDLEDPYSMCFVINGARQEELEGRAEEEVYSFLGEECEAGDFDLEMRTLFIETLKSRSTEVRFYKNSTEEYGDMLTGFKVLYGADGEPACIISTDLDINDIQQNMKLFIAGTAIISLIMMALLVFVFLVFFHTKVTGPITSISRNTDQFVQQLDENVTPEELHYEEVPVRSRDEIHTLSSDITALAGSLKSYMSNLQTVAAEKQRISSELSIATQIQADMLPRIFPPFPERKEFMLHATMDPAKEVGGDFYDFFFIDDDHLCLVMADVSGKGVPAALFMVISKTLIKNRAQMGDSPAEIMKNVNTQLCDGNEAEMFVTVWVAILEISTGKGIAANAGHERPAIRRKDGKFELLFYRHSPALAMMDGIRFKEHEFQLNPGDSLFVYTDGVPEATNIRNELFGNERMLDALNRDPDAEPETLLRTVRQEVDEFTGEAPQFDDITMLGLKYLGPQQQA